MRLPCLLRQETVTSACILCSEKNALQTLKSSDWQLEAAYDVFYSKPQPRSNNAAGVRRLQELYNRYKGLSYFLIKRAKVITYIISFV